MGLSITIVRVIFSAQKKRWKNPTQKIIFFYLKCICAGVYICVYMCIYKKRDTKLIVSRSRSRSRSPDV